MSWSRDRPRGCFPCIRSQAGPSAPARSAWLAVVCRTNRWVFLLIHPSCQEPKLKKPGLMQCFLYLHHAKHCEAKCGCPTCARPQSAGDRQGQGTVAQDSTSPTAVDGMWPVPCHISWDSVSPPPWVMVPSSLSPGLSLGPAATLSDMGQDARGDTGAV